MTHVVLTGIRGNISDHAAANVLQMYLGYTMPEALRVLEDVREGKRVSLEIDDEYAAYDLASLLTDLGVAAEAEDYH